MTGLGQIRFPQGTSMWFATRSASDGTSQLVVGRSEGNLSVCDRLRSSDIPRPLPQI